MNPTTTDKTKRIEKKKKSFKIIMQYYEQIDLLLPVFVKFCPLIIHRNIGSQSHCHRKLEDDRKPSLRIILKSRPVELVLHKVAVDQEL